MRLDQSGYTDGWLSEFSKKGLHTCTAGNLAGFIESMAVQNIVYVDVICRKFQINLRQHGKVARLI